MNTLENDTVSRETITIRKTCTKTHNIKIGYKQFITFEAYRSLLIGKRDKTYFSTIDLILDVFKDNFNMINYRVKSLEDNQIRIHGTNILINEVF